MNRWFLYVLVLLVLASQSKRAEGSGELDNAHSASLSFEVNYVYRTAGVGELKTIKNGDSLQSGDHYKIVFTPNKNCYVYIFQIDSSGQVYQLFPMKSFRGVRLDNVNPVQKEETYILPSPNKAFVLDKVVGIERIYFIVSTDQSKELEGLHRELRAVGTHKGRIRASVSKDKLNKYFKRRGIAVVPSEESIEVPWKELGDALSVSGQRLEALCEHCVHLLEFVHQ